MEINLEWIYEDTIEVDDENDLKSVYFDNEAETLRYCDTKTININEGEKSIFISPKKELQSAIEELLKEDEVKEKKYSEIREKFEEQKTRIFLPKIDMEKVFFSKIRRKDNMYYALLGKIVEDISYKKVNFIKEMREISSSLIKMRTNLIFTYYYQIFLYLYNDSIETIYQYSELIICNKQNILTFIEVFVKVIKRMAKDINVNVLEKIKGIEVFHRFKKEISSCLSFIELYIQYYVLARYLGCDSNSLVFSGNLPSAYAQCSEQTFSLIKQFLEQFPTLESLKENMDTMTDQLEMLSMSLVRDLGIYKKYEKKAFSLIYEFLLYSE